MKTFQLEIITPERKVFSEIVESISVPTPTGTIGVFARHEPLFSALSEGEVKITSGAKEFFLAIGGGFMEVTKSGVSILVSRAVHAAELNEADIKKAQEAAREALSKPNIGIDRAAAQAILRRSVLELKVLRRPRASTYRPS